MDVRFRKARGIFYVLATSTLACAGPLLAQSGTGTAPGILWNSLDRVERLMFVRGFIDGAAAAESVAIGYFNAIEESGVLPPGTLDIFKTGVTERIEYYSRTTVSQMEPLVDSITQLYADPANSCIPLFPIGMTALQRLRGTLLDSELPARLGELRRVRADC